MDYNVRGQGSLQCSEKEAFPLMTTAKYLSSLLEFLPRPVDFPVIAVWSWEVWYEVTLPETFTLRKER